MMIAFMLSYNSKQEEYAMYQIDFYEKRTGISDVWNFLETLRLKSENNKDARNDYIRQQKERLQ